MVSTRYMPVFQLNLYTVIRQCSGYSLAKNLKDCYYLLRVAEESPDDEIKEAYINLAKEYHPDSNSSTSDPNKFAQIEQAYRVIQEHRRKLEKEKLEKEEAFFDIRHTAPQHRQYLSHEGKGLGNPFQRERQYKAYKASRATENVFEHQMQKFSAKYENSLVTKDKEATRKRTIRNQMDRLVEDYIQEAMSRGEFSNLKGQGRPLQLPPDHNPMIDKTTHQLNRVLINNGYAPEWVMLKKEIRQSIHAARDALLLERTRAGCDLDRMDPKATKRWKDAQQAFKSEICDINKKIQNLNLITPTLQQQMFLYIENKELHKVSELYSKLASSGNLPEIPSEELNDNNVIRPPRDNEKMTAKMIWKDIRALFSS